MNLLMISGDRSIPQGKKGSFWYTLEEMSKHWERIDVICPRAELRIKNKELCTHPFKNVFLHPSSRRLWYQSRWIVKKGKELITKHHHAVMTVHEYPPFYNGVGAKRLHKKTGVPYVLEVMHVIGYPRASSIAEWIGRVLSQWYLRFDAKRATAVRCICAMTRDLLAKWGIPKEKSHIVSAFYLDRASLKSDPCILKEYDVVTSARLAKNKGIDRLIQAVALCKNASLLIIGDGPERKNLEKLSSKLGVEDRVSFSGWLPAQEDVYRAMQSGDIFVCSSLSEGGPRTVLEAMALGIPVITTRVGVMPEVIQDGGNGFFTTGEPHDLAFRIAALLENEELRNALSAAGQKILDVFEREKLIREYADFLKYLFPSP